MRVRDLGRMEYGACLEIQRDLHAQRTRGEGEDTILLVEHPPVATLGRRGAPSDVFDATLPVFAVERGGKATYHGPGQLVVYPIVHLGEGCRDVRAWVQCLEALAVDYLAHAGVPAEARIDQPGVWSTATGRKVASIGIAIQAWVSLHGIALNIDLDLREFERLDPCGLGAATMTSVKEEGGRADMDDARAWMTAHAGAHIEAWQRERRLVQAAP